MTSKEKDLKNGSNVIVTDADQRILVVREKTRENRWMLPGGEVDRGESPLHAAVSEAEEETDIVIDEEDLIMVGVFVQRPKGVVFLYEALRYTGEIAIDPNSQEVMEACFMSFDEIVRRREEFRLAYLRMIFHYRKYKTGDYKRFPVHARLSDEVIFANVPPDGFLGSGEDYIKLLLRA